MQPPVAAKRISADAELAQLRASRERVKLARDEALVEAVRLRESLARAMTQLRAARAAAEMQERRGDAFEAAERDAVAATEVVLADLATARSERAAARAAGRAAAAATAAALTEAAAARGELASLREELQAAHASTELVRAERCSAGEAVTSDEASDGLVIVHLARRE